MFDLALYIVYRMSRQENATFVEQSLSTEVVSYFYLPLFLSLMRVRIRLYVVEKKLLAIPREWFGIDSRSV